MTNPKTKQPKARKPMSAEIVQLHDRLTIILSPEATRRIRDKAESEAKSRAAWLELGRPELGRKMHPLETPEAVVEDAISTLYGPWPDEVYGILSGGAA
jgi:hypothetical protein